LGILDPLAGDEVDEDSVGYFDAIDEELVGATRVDSYSSVKEGELEKSVNIAADVKMLNYANTVSWQMNIVVTVFSSQSH
jgi:hypothetical protein